VLTGPRACPRARIAAVLISLSSIRTVANACRANGQVEVMPNA
jgi:hypothetical protein